MTFSMKARRAGWLLIIAAFAFGLFTGLRPSTAAAYGLVTNRSIKMSSSIDAATGVIYTTGFTTATTGTAVGSIVIHFCSNDPIIGDSCTAPNGFNDNFATLVLANFSSSNTLQFPNTGWTVDQTNSKSNAIILKRASTFTPTATATIGFDLGDGLSTATSITNPDFSASNPSTTFFARITIYSTLTPDVSPANVATTEKTAFDAGGVAMSTDTTLSLTAKVQEQLTFCVYTTATCAGGVGNGIINLGDPNGVLAATNTNYMDASTHWDLASNALGGVVVRLKGDTLRSGTFTIDPQIGAGNTCAADSTSTSVEQFGVRVVTYGANQYNGGATDATGPGQNAGNIDDYGCLAGNHKWVLASTNTTYGEPFVRTFGATDSSNTNIEFAAKAANTTEAGVYKTTIQLIATATY